MISGFLTIMSRFLILLVILFSCPPLRGAPLLVHLNKGHFEGDLEVLEGRFELQDYGIAFPENSILREPVNRVMLNIIHEPEWQETLKKYLGD